MLAKARSNADPAVLVAGGAYPATSELYDPRNESWTATGDMVEDRFDSAATLLPDGAVLVAGAGTAELYDPRSGTWTATGAMIKGDIAPLHGIDGYRITVYFAASNGRSATDL